MHSLDQPPLNDAAIRTARQWGEALEGAFDALDQQIGGNGDMLLIRAKIRGLLAGYHAKWCQVQAGRKVLAVEESLNVALYNPDSTRQSRTFRLAGKIDVLENWGSEVILMDHKTTSEDIGDPAAPYWRQLVVEGQLTHYLWMLWIGGIKIDAAVWDVVRKPMTSPKQVVKREWEQTLRTGQYFERDLSAESLEALARDQRETFEMYEARLAFDCTNDRPEWYFQRRRIPRLDSEVIEYAGELWNHGQDIIDTRQNERWSRNSGACLDFKSPCKFLGLCSGHDEPTSENWRKKQWVHDELVRIGEGDGSDLLTNSRIRSFQTCRRKHFYQYELGIDRVEYEDREALVFGTLWHAALAAWFDAFKQPQQENHGNDNVVPATSVGSTTQATPAL